MAKHRLWAGTVLFGVLFITAVVTGAWWLYLAALIGVVLIVCSFAEEGARR
jgi:cytochrome c biogenesis protein ResB